MSKWIFRVECFEVYGLDVQNNFLRECTLSLKTNTELFEFMITALNLHECDRCAVFAIDIYGSMWAGIKRPQSQERIDLLVKEKFDLEFFARIVKEYGLTCYSLIIETEIGKWKAVTN